MSDLLELGRRRKAVEQGLVVGDVVVDRAHLDEVDGMDGRVLEALGLADRRQDPRPVGAQLAVLSTTPNSIVNQNTCDKKRSASSLLVRSTASPTSRYSSAKVGSAIWLAWPITSWMMSGSGVYSGTDGWRRYWVDQNTRSAKEP